jgi:hypothetical protein
VSRCGAVAAKKRTGGPQSTWDVSDAFDRPGWNKLPRSIKFGSRPRFKPSLFHPHFGPLRLGALGPRSARGAAAVVLKLSAQGSRSLTRSAVGRKVREQRLCVFDLEEPQRSNRGPSDLQHDAFPTEPSRLLRRASRLHGPGPSQAPNAVAASASRAESPGFNPQRANCKDCRLESCRCDCPHRKQSSREADATRGSTSNAKDSATEWLR